LACIFGALLLLAACETVSTEGPEPALESVTAPPPAPVQASDEPAAPEADLSELTPLGETMATALDGPEFYRGSGVLARRPRQTRADVELLSGGDVTLNFANAEIREVVDAVLGRTLGVNYIIDAKVQGQVTARTSKPIPRADVISALENILAFNGAALVRDGAIYKVLPLQQAATGFPSPVMSPSAKELSRGFGLNVIPLEFASARAMADLLKPFVAPGRVLRVDPSRNLLLFAGPGSETRDLLEMIELFDVDWMGGMSFALFPVQVADAKSLVEDLETVFQQATDGPLADVVRFVAIERLNAVLAITPQRAYLKRIETWVDRLDRGAEGTGRRIFVYHVQNSRAEDLASVLSQVFETGGTAKRAAPEAELAPGLSPVSLESLGASPGAEAPPAALAEGTQAAAGQEGAQAAQQARRARTAPAVSVAGGARRNDLESIAAVEQSGDIRIIADEKNNALVILATSAEYRMIEATLKRLDITPLQVLIEVTIAEVTLNDELKYGLQWFFASGSSSFTLSPLADGAVASLFPGFSYFFNTADKTVALNALAEITDVRVISSPQLMVLDNQTARLQVGDQVPIATQSAVSVTDPEAPIVNSIQFRDTGVILEVTPRVNASGLVVLDVKQEVSDVVPTTTSDIDSPTIQQRNIESTVAVQSGDTVALGGLIRDNRSEATTGIPLLSEIPILGNLFKTTTETTRRTELLVLITPKVVRDRNEAREVTEELRRRMGALAPLEKKLNLPSE
jgi:general secretion pathway protein D